MHYFIFNLIAFKLDIIKKLIHIYLSKKTHFPALYLIIIINF